MRKVTRDEMREIDRTAIEEYGIPGIILMENAGRSVAEGVAADFAGTEKMKAAVLCGKGNNAGDGFVIARHLANRAFDVIVYLFATPGEIAKSPDADINYRIALNMGIPMASVGEGKDLSTDRLAEDLRAFPIVIDALLGTGIRGELKEPFLSAVAAINDSSATVYSVDTPSGLDVDSGKPCGAAVKANKTITMALPKAGFFAEGAEEYTGELVVADIGVPRTLLFDE